MIQPCAFLLLFSLLRSSLLSFALSCVHRSSNTELHRLQIDWIHFPAMKIKPNGALFPVYECNKVIIFLAKLLTSSCDILSFARSIYCPKNCVGNKNSFNKNFTSKLFQLPAKFVYQAKSFSSKIWFGLNSM